MKAPPARLTVMALVLLMVVPSGNGLRNLPEAIDDAGIGFLQEVPASTLRTPQAQEVAQPASHNATVVLAIGILTVGAFSIPVVMGTVILVRRALDTAKPLKVLSVY